MKENEVVESVKAWLTEIFPKHTVSDPSLGSHSDFLLSNFHLKISTSEVNFSSHFS